MAKNNIIDASELDGYESPVTEIDASELDTEQPKSGTIRRALGDTGVSLLKGAIGVPETVVGLADLVTGGHAGKLAESAGFKPKQAKEIISDYYSPEQKLANQKVQEADGFVNTIQAALQNPSTIVQTTAESLPVMGLGGVASRGLLTVAPKVAPFIAGAAGEGLVTAGQNAEQVRQENADGLLTGKQAAIQAGSGLLTGVISGASGKLVDSKLGKALGLSDPETMLATGQLTGQATRSLPKSIAGSIVTEGLLEEAPQSAQEQIAQNLSLDKPWDEGVGNAAAMGALSGGLMGGGANALNAFGGKDNTQVTPPPAPPAPEGSLTSAATIAQAVGLTPQPVTPDVTEAKPNIVDSLNAVEAQQNGVMPDTAIAPIEPATIAPEQAAEKQIIDEQAQQAATSPLNDLPQPTEAQTAAGNYKKGHIKYDGLNITVENPQGSTRSGVDEDGATWENTLKNHYGYIKRTKGNDGDNLDVFVGDKPANGKVFVINQTKKDGSFDEHKAVLGAETADEAIAIYKANYADDWNGGKSVTELTTPAFKDWLKNGDPTKPLETVSATSNDVDMTKVAVGEQVDVGGVPYVKTEIGFERVTSATNNVVNATSVDTVTTLPERVDETANGVQVPAINQAIVGEDDLPFDSYAQKNVDAANNAKANWISAQTDLISARDIAFTDSDKLYEDIKQNRRGMTFEKATSLIDAAEKDAIVDSVIANKLRNDIAPLATTNNAEPAQPADTVRPLVEQLTKLRATADKHPSFDPALKAAKDFMAGKKVSPRQFKNFANLLGKKNKAFREVLMQLHDQAASTPEQLAAKEKKSKLAKAMLEERMKLDTTKDGLMQAMAKLGGLNADKAKAEFGIDPADMRQHGAGIKRSFNKNGLDADTMRELLLEQGYPVGETVADLGNAIADAMSGIDVLTAAGQEALAQKKYEEYANGIDELSDDEQALLDELVTKATAKYGAEALAEIDASLAESMKGQPQVEIERALLRMLKEEFDDETGNAGTSQATEGQTGEDTETGSTENGSGRAQQDGASIEGQGNETSQDLLGDNTAAKQALADAERAKDAKRNSGNDNQDTFTLSGSDSEFEQARAAGAQDLVEASQAEEKQEAYKLTFDQWLENRFNSNEYSSAYLNKANGDKRQAMINSATGDPDGSTEAMALSVYNKEVMNTPRDKKIPLSVYDQLSKEVQADLLKYNFGLENDLNERNAKAATDLGKEREAQAKPYQEALNAVNDELKKQQGKPVNETFNNLLKRQGALQNALVEIQQGKEPDKRLIKQSPAEQPKPETKPANNIQDLGEKIGGARKDTAVSTGIKAKRTDRNPEVPTWAKRYNITETVYSSDEKENGTWSIYDSRDKNRLGLPREIGKGFASKEAAMAELPALVVGAKHRVVATAQRPDGTYGFEIYRSINDRKRVKIVDKEFDSRVEALTYMGEHAAEILETNTTFGEVDLPTPDDTNRIGVARRSGDVQSQDFMDTFGFRGVEFGNWNNQIERQQVMNAAYDGLLDLAEVLNLPPKALTLNGDLALAFGARGQGLSSAKAHYESNRAVINLTKMNGAGSLAHEFFHALDHYLGRQDGKASSEWIVNADGTRELKAKEAEKDFVSSGFSYKSNVREEVRTAYKDLMETMFRKATTYVEDTKQADDFVARAKDDLASKLDSIRNELSAQKDPKYYKRNNKPATAEQLAEFDTVAKQLLDGQGLDAEYRAIDDGRKRTRKWQLPAGRHTNDALEKISAIYKAVRGRNGFDSQNNHGTMDYLRGTMTRYSGRLKMLADAQQGNEKVRQVPTNFALNAKELDQGRGKDYWTTPHEMAARAFQGYVEDKIAATGGKSPFLNYGREGAGILTPWGVKFPFPRGEERKAINTALDKFVSALQTKETDKGIALYQNKEEYGNYGITEKQRSELTEPERRAYDQSAATAIALRGVKNSVLGLAVSKDFKQTGSTSLLGKQIATPEDLAVAAQVYRDPRFETVRYFFIKDGSVISQTSVTSKLAGVATLSPNVNGEGVAEFISEIAAEAANLGADGVYLLHNHPDGNPTPSKVDVTATKFIQGVLAEKNIDLLGHVIINHQKYAVIDRENNQQVIERKFENTYSNDNPAVPHAILGKVISDQYDLAEHAKAIEFTEGNIILIGTSGTSGISVITEIEPADLKPLKLAAILRKLSRQSGAESLFAYNVPLNLSNLAAKAIKNSILVDAITTDTYGNKQSLRSFIDPDDNVTMGRPLKGYVVKQTGVNENYPVSAKGLTELTNLKENVVAAKRQFDKMTADRRAGNLTLEQYEKVLDGVINSEADLAKALVALPDEGFALQGKTRSGNTLILAPSVKNKGQWQLSRFDERGAFGDSERKTKLEAVKLLIEEADISTITDYDVRFSRPSAPTFYSALAKAIPLAKQDTMPAGQWKNWLVANAGKMNVKQAELQWSGLTDWLELQTGKLSKADIQQYLDANGVQVTETMLGETSRINTNSKYYIPEVKKLIENNQGQADNAIVLALENDYDAYTALNKKFPDLMEDENWAEMVANDVAGGTGNAVDTKYGKYTVAGGDNYKELLLTLPKRNGVKALSAGALDDIWNVEMADGTTISFPTRMADDKAEAFEYAENQRGIHYQSGHFDQSNILAHVRFDERTDADGNKVLFINEIQSDWGQDGKRIGFANRTTAEIEKEQSAVNREKSKLIQEAADLPDSKMAEFKKLNEKIKELTEKSNALFDEWNESVGRKVVPTAPFVTETKSWVALALKRMIRYAAENGFDKVALINGQQAADLYDLSKQIDEVRAFKNDDGTFNIDAWNNGTAVLEKESLNGQELADTVGKELAEKIASESGNAVSGHNNGRSYKGGDLKVGGEGMRAFYDQIVPQVANDVLKKIGGGKVESIKFNLLRNKNEIPSKYFLDAEDIGADGDMQQEVIIRDSLTMEGVVEPLNSINEAKAWISKNHVDAKQNSQLGFTITPELRAKALEGLPLFSRPQSKFSQKSTGIDIRDLNAVVANVNQALRGLPATYVLEDYTKAPAELVADIKRDKAYDAAGAWHNGEIYLFRNNIINTNHALFTMLHESTHEGLRRVFGKEIDATLMGIYLSNKDIKQQADSLRATHKDLSLVASVEEALADMGGNGIKASVMDKLIAFVRNFLRRLGMNLNVSDREVRAIVTRALDSVKSPSKVTHYTIGSAYSAASSGDQTNTPEFKAWFKDSKVVDKFGKPLEVFHGAPDARFVKEDGIFKNMTEKYGGTGGSRAFWFASSRQVANTYADDRRAFDYQAAEAGIIPAYLSLQNPLIVEGGGKVWREAQAIGKTTDVIAKAQENGNDGVIIRNVKDDYNSNATSSRVTDTYVVFSSNQIKSSTDNSGDFDPNNPDIRYSRPTPRLSPVVQPTTPNQQWQSPDKSKLDNVIYMLQNKFVDLKRVTQAIQKSGNTIEDKWNPYLLEENFTGRTAKRTKDFLKQELEPLMKSMQARKVEMADFEEYLWARHAEERNIQIAKINPAMQDGGSGMTTQDARDYLANLTPAQTANYQALAAKVDAILKTSRQRLISYGLETPETIAAWEGAYQHYVPLMREDMDNGFGNGSGQGFSVKGNASKRATGSKRAVVDVLANIAQQVERNIIRGEKNRVSTALVGLATLNPNKDFWKVDVVPKMRTVVAGKNTYEVLYNGSVVQNFTNPVEANKFIQWNGAGYTLNIVKGQDLVMDVPDPSYKNRDNIVVARIVNAKGKIEEHFVEFNTHDERAMRAAASIKNLDQDQIGELLGTASSITRYFSSINTQYNPFFGVINILRDVQGSLLNLSSTALAGKQLDVLKNTPLALKGIYQDIRSERKTGTPTNSYWSLLFEDFQKQGGQTGYRDMYRNAKERGEALKHALDPTWWQQTTAGKIVTINGILAKPEQFLKEAGQKYIFDWLSDYNESMENAVRLSAYKVALDNGMSKAQAASLAKNISVNFNRKGEMGRQIGSLYAFFNASVQGTARIGETLFTDDNGKLTLSKAGKAIVSGGLLLGVMQALMLAAAGFGDDEPPEFVRDRNLIIPLGNGKAITIAMPLGFNALPAFGRILTEWALSGGEDTSKRFFHIFEMLAEVTNPIGNAGLSMQTITPTMFDPLAALAENKDWTGRPIAKIDFNSQKPTAGHTRAKDTASAISKGLSWVINEATGGSDYTPGALSPTPDQIDYLLGQIFGGVGREYMKLEQSATSIVTGEDLPVYKIPLVGRFYLDAEGQSSQSSRFYDNLKSVFETETELKGLRKDGLDTAEYRASHPEAALVFRANLEQREISQLYKIRSEKLKADASPDEIKALNERITARMLKFNELFKTRTTAGE